MQEIHQHTDAHRVEIITENDAYLVTKSYTQIQ